jgi:hypothetical protein
MFNAIISAIVAGAVAVSSWFGLHYFEKPLSVGNASLTTINSTDRITDSRAVINTNFDNLNTDKLSINTFSATTTHPNISSLPSLVSVGIITTGTWSGTAIAVAKGGTGTTSPTANLVMVGNGASGLKNVSGTGSSGQFLTSNGAGVDPSWQSSTVDQTANYTWSGGHVFQASTTLAATTTIAASSVTNNALVINGVPLQYPPTQGASSTVLANNGSGVFTWYPTTSIVGATASAVLQQSANTERTEAGSTPVKVKEIRVQFGGTFRVKFDLKTDTAIRTVAGRIYKNGVAYGTAQTTTGDTDYHTFSEDLLFTQNDLVQLYINRSSPDGQIAYARNFQIFYTKDVISDSVVITD